MSGHPGTVTGGHRVRRRVLHGRARASLLSTALSPGVLRAAVHLGQALGLPVALSGFWSTVGVCVLVGPDDPR